MNLIDRMQSLPQCYKDGIRGVLLLHRTKDGGAGNVQRRSFKRVSRNADEWNLLVTEMESLRQSSPLWADHRIYASVNPRDINKAIHEFSHRKVDSDNGSDDNRNWWYIDIQNNFFSCLMQPGAKKDSLYLIDCDTEEQFVQNLKILPAEIIDYTYPTKNGHHIITRAYWPHTPVGEIHKDGLIYVG